MAKEKGRTADVKEPEDASVRQSVELSRHRGFGGDKKLFLQLIAAKRSQNNATELNLQEFSKVFAIKDKQLAQDLFRAFDTNGDGNVTLEELKLMADLLEKGDPQARIDRATSHHHNPRAPLSFMRSVSAIQGFRL